MSWLPGRPPPTAGGILRPSTDQSSLQYRSRGRPRPKNGRRTVARCLVTGGAGFLGSRLTDALLADGQQVRVLDDFSAGNPANLVQVVDRIELMRGSVADAAVVQQ